MNLLIDVAPKSINIGGKDYDINSDFRTSILFELLMQDDELSDNDKIKFALELYYPILPNDITEAIEKILWFYRCGKHSNNYSNGSKSKGSNSSQQVYNFEFDDDYIYSAFLSQYGIDLQDIDNLHWWKFKAMFKSLKEDNEIVKIMGYRSMDLSKIKDKDQKYFYNKMKKIYELPKNKNEVEKINEIENALMSGKGLINIL